MLMYIKGLLCKSHFPDKYSGTHSDKSFIWNDLSLLTSYHSSTTHPHLLLPYRVQCTLPLSHLSSISTHAPRLPDTRIFKNCQCFINYYSYHTRMCAADPFACMIEKELQLYFLTYSTRYSYVHVLVLWTFSTCSSTSRFPLWTCTNSSCIKHSNIGLWYR